MTVNLTAQASLNPDPDGQPLSVVVRFYQLKDVKTFAELNYMQFQSDNQKLLKADVVATKDVVLRPGATTSFTEPLNEATQIVGVIAFFREPEPDKTWKLVIPNGRWKKTTPVTIEVSGNELRLAEAKPTSKN